MLNKSYPPLMAKEFTEATLAAYIDTVNTLAEHLNKELVSHGKTYICGDKLTTADFHAFAYVMSFVWNKSCVAPVVWTE